MAEGKAYRRVKDGKFLNFWPEHDKKLQQDQVNWCIKHFSVSEQDLEWARLNIYELRNYHKQKPMPLDLTTI